VVARLAKMRQARRTRIKACPKFDRIFKMKTTGHHLA